MTSCQDNARLTLWPSSKGQLLTTCSVSCACYLPSCSGWVSRLYYLPTCSGWVSRVYSLPTCSGWVSRLYYLPTCSGWVFRVYSLPTCSGGVSRLYYFPTCSGWVSRVYSLPTCSGWVSRVYSLPTCSGWVSRVYSLPTCSGWVSQVYYLPCWWSLGTPRWRSHHLQRTFSLRGQHGQLRLRFSGLHATILLVFPPQKISLKSFWITYRYSSTLVQKVKKLTFAQAKSFVEIALFFEGTLLWNLQQLANLLFINFASKHWLYRHQWCMYNIVSAKRKCKPQSKWDGQ